jgi:hypothetical protein
MAKLRHLPEMLVTNYRMQDSGLYASDGSYFHGVIGENPRAGMASLFHHAQLPIGRVLIEYDRLPVGD